MIILNPALCQTCQVAFFVCGGMALSIALYLFVEWWNAFTAHPPVRATVPVAMGPYIVSRGRRTRRRDYLTAGRLQCDLHRMRILQRQLSLRGIVA